MTDGREAIAVAHLGYMCSFARVSFVLALQSSITHMCCLVCVAVALSCFVLLTSCLCRAYVCIRESLLSCDKMIFDPLPV